MTPGDRLGPYEIIAKVGEGGMGEVYRAKDTKRGRGVPWRSSSDRREVCHRGGPLWTGVSATT